jgi:hypothetical protein
MGVIKYGVCLKKNPVKGTTKAYAVINSEEFNFTDMAEQVTAETTVTRTDCVAVMRAVVDIAKREILKGNRIVLGDDIDIPIGDSYRDQLNAYINSKFLTK